MNFIELVKVQNFGLFFYYSLLNEVKWYILDDLSTKCDLKWLFFCCTNQIPYQTTSKLYFVNNFSLINYKCIDRYIIQR